MAAKMAAFVFVFSLVCYPQRFGVSNYSVDDGLSTQRVNAVTQDARGFIWAATQSGISSYNGIRWKNYDTSSGLPLQPYRFIAADKGGRIWGAPDVTRGGLVVFENERWRPVFNLGNAFAKRNIRDFTLIDVHGQTQCVLATDSSLYIIENGTYREIGGGEGFPRCSINCLYSVGERCYVATSQGLFLLRGGRIDSAYPATHSPLLGQVLAVGANRFSSRGELYVLCPSSICMIEAGTVSQLTSFPAESRSFNSGARIAVRFPFIFFGDAQHKEAYHLTEKILSPLNVDNGFSTDGFQNIFICREGIIWISDLRGIDKISMPYLMHFDKGQGLGEREVSAIAELVPGVMAFGHNNGITLYRDGQTKYLSLNSRSKESNATRVMEFSPDGNGNQLVASTGLYSLSSSGTLTLLSRFSARILSVQAVSSKEIWLAAIQGIHFSENGGKTFRTYSGHPGTARRLRYFGGQEIFVCSTTGFGAINIRTREYRRILYGFAPRFDVFDVFPENDSTFLVATVAGLFRYQRGSYDFARLGGKKINSAVYTILNYRPGAYFFGTNEGVFRWREGIDPERFDRSAGLIGSEVNRGALIKDSFNRFWAGTERGASCYDPKADNVAIHPPVAAIEGIETADGKLRPLEDGLTLPHSENFIHFRVYAPSFVNERSLEFEYRLAGHDTSMLRCGWTGARSLRYGGLPAGDYALEIRARNRNGVWGPTIRSSVIHVEPPFYLSFWFLSVLVVIAAGGYYGFTKYTSDRRYRLHLESAVSERSKDLRDSNEKLHILNDELEGRVAQRTAELEELNSKLLQDIGVRQRMQLEIQEARERYETIFRTTGDAMLLVDAGTGDLLDANEAAARFYGYLPEEFQGKTIRDLSNEAEKSMAALQRGTAHIPLCIHRKKTGEAIPAEVFSGTFTQGGRNIAVVSLRDISSYIDTQTKLENYSHALEELNRSKDKFFSIIAHDLKSPFQGLLGFSDLLLHDYNQFTDDERIEMLRRLHTLSQKAYELLENLLQWSRLQLGRIKPDAVVFPLREVVGNAIAILRPQASAKNIDVLDSTVETTTVFGDIIMVKQALQNLLSNAVKFSQPGQNILIRSADRGDGTIRITVEDRGMGIRPKDAERLFKPDEQLITPGTSGEKGTGLGLLIAQELMALNKGTVTYEPNPAGGSLFSLILPRG